MKGIALRGQNASRPQGLVCHFCQFSKSPAPRRAPFARQYSSASPLHRNGHLGQMRLKKGPKTPSIPPKFAPRRFESSTPEPPSSLDPETALHQVTNDASVLHNSDSVPSDESVVQLLERCQEIVETLVSREQDHQGQASSATREEGSAISSLLDLEEKNAGKKRTKSAAGNIPPQLVNSISQVANDLVKDEKVFISPNLLA